MKAESAQQEHKRRTEVNERQTKVNERRNNHITHNQSKVRKGYLEGVGIMALERLTGVLDQLIIKCHSNYAKILGELITTGTVIQTLENVQRLEMNELFTYQIRFYCPTPKQNSRTLFLILKRQRQVIYLRIGSFKIELNENLR